MTKENDDGSRRLKSVKQAFDMIEYLRTDGPTTLSDVAQSLDLPMSTAHIHLATLVDSGYVVKSDGKYQCSLLFLRTGGELRDEMPLFRAAKNEVDNLQEKLGEIANLATIENGYMVQLYKSENAESIDDNAPLGDHFYMHTTATGKSMLAHLPQEDCEDILERRGLPRSTEGTIDDYEELMTDLETIRERGYSINRGEHFGGVCAAAVPIMSKNHSVLGAISLSGPISRMSDERIEDEISPELFDKKNIIELKLKQY
ncbi:IclR family transcriptional regulator [Haladaptatus sp. DYF46]|uniref:IclR family transcriptional regulator n=1 Tax=Haladaptatus sp. DYF46 TaxID=2886041 RepID=UPI001E4E69ED|nr:IclR family transcriptional regulator [Haladaptatus sp. DYF46]